MQIARPAIFLGTVLMLPDPAHSLEPARLVLPLRDQTAIDGCSWTASSIELGKGFIFLSEYDDSRSLMNIDGADVELALVADRGGLKKVGDTLRRSYRADGLSIEATYEATWVCPDGDESCEVTRYKVTLVASKGSRRQVVQATGDVGC